MLLCGVKIAVLNTGLCAWPTKVLLPALNVVRDSYISFKIIFIVFIHIFDKCLTF